MLLAPSSSRWRCALSSKPSIAGGIVSRSSLGRYKRCVSVCAHGGIELDEIKKWFESKIQSRNPLFADENEENAIVPEKNRVDFDLNLAVVLAGFAFEAYNTPPKDAGIRENDGRSCETIFLNHGLVRELYQGQLTVKLERANQLPGFDLWGTSDPYVWLRIGDIAKKSRTVWASKDPVWDETITLNVADPQTQSLQIAVWDENILSVHRRLGNTAVPLEALCDGSLQELKMDLEGMGGGGTITFEVSYKTFSQIDEERSWKIPLLSDLMKGTALNGLLTSIFGTEGIKVQDFIGSAFVTELPDSSKLSAVETAKEDTKTTAEQALLSFDLVKNLKLPQLGWDFQVYDKLKQMGQDYQAEAHSRYIEQGLANADVDREAQVECKDAQVESMMEEKPQASEVTNALVDMLGRTEEALGSWLMSKTPFASQSQQAEAVKPEELPADADAELEKLRQEQMAAMFRRAETAMEAWAILATSLGRTSFVKSEFEKICFIENEKTDTQVAVWRDVRGSRLIVAFRGTEQTKWKDLATDLMLVPTGFNPERSADGDYGKEVFVHSGFLSAYDSVRHRLVSIIKASVAQSDGDPERKWHIYVTGHSLGGALATLLTMDLTQSRMVKCGKVLLTMYNFGSPRVGNKSFAEQYNETVLDSWRIVNHRDIIPTVPRLMGYCHVAQPMYLPSLKNSQAVDDGYSGDVIGEATPVAIVGEFLKGETNLIEKLLRTEVTMLRAIRDGSALMQHMEDFYYISLLELVSAQDEAVRTA